MGTVVFDFDSTLIPDESLELALAGALGGDATATAEIERITRAGMEGEMGFAESLERRLAIAQPQRADLEALGQALAARLTDGALRLIGDLRAQGHAVWIVSGAFREVLLPAGRALGLDAVHVQGVRPRWDPAGGFAGLDPEDGFSQSKVEGIRQLAPDWARPAVGVGDGMTDHALWAEGQVDAFVPYLEHAQRDAVLALGLPGASNMEELSQCLATLLN